MSMTKSDYELIATVVRQFEPETREKLAWMFLGQFYANGYKHDENKFLKACGIGE